MFKIDHKDDSGVIRTPITFSRFLLILFLAGCSISGWMRVSQTLVNRDWIDSLNIGVGSWYFAFSGIVWGCLFLIALAAVLIQWRWAGWFTITTSVIFSIWRWAERLFLSRSPLVKTGWLFELLLNAALLAIVFFMMKGYPPARKNG